MDSRRTPPPPATSDGSSQRRSTRLLEDQRVETASATQPAGPMDAGGIAGTPGEGRRIA